MPLSPQDIDQIRLEEALRAEVRAKLAEDTKAASAKNPMWAFVNSTFGIWLLSAVFISGAGALFTNAQQQRADAEKRRDVVEKLDLEIGYRFSQVLLRLYDLSDQGAPRANLKNSATEADVKKVLQILHESPLKSITALYPEYDKYGLPSLLAELKRFATSKEERAKIDRSLAALIGKNIEDKDFQTSIRALASFLTSSCFRAGRARPSTSQIAQGAHRFAET